MKLYFSTNNAHKISEAIEILGGELSRDVEVLPMSALGCEADIPETADSLEGNSLIKAKFLYDRYHVDCFADDTGLEVEALNGEPGIFSARYAGEPVDSAANRKKLLQNLKDKNNRRAQMRTVVTVILNGKPYQFEGVVKGVILTEERGDGGFGYDSIFMPDGYDKTFAELPPETKNKISHRAIALNKIAEFLYANANN